MDMFRTICNLERNLKYTGVNVTKKLMQDSLKTMQLHNILTEKEYVAGLLIIGNKY